MAEVHQFQGQSSVAILRGYELRLLRCTLAPPPSDSSLQSQSSLSSPSHESNLHSHINYLLNSIEAGNYLQVLSSDAVKPFIELPLVAESVDQVYSQSVERVEQFIGKDSDSVDEEMACRTILVLCVAVAAFLCFTQANITGPVVELPKCPFPFQVSECEEFLEWDNWARNQLMFDGSELLAKFSNLQYVVLAKMLVMRTKDLLFEGSISFGYGIRSISWWLARILLIQQKILDEPSSSLFDLMQVSMGEALHNFGTLEQVKSYWGDELHGEEALAIVSMVHLEAGIMEHTYGRIDSCRMHFESAEVAAGLELSVTGILGYRTVHQAEPKAQRVLVANRSSSESGSTSLLVSPGIHTNVSTVAEDNLHLHEHEKSEVSDILLTPVLLENSNKTAIKEHGNQNGGPVGAAPLTAIQQAVILSRCLLIEKSARQDELYKWDMAPFIEVIDSQQSLFFTLRCFCHLLRVRWESTRSRTKERALLMMEKLVQSVRQPLPGVALRIPLCYVVHVPAIPALQKEYGELLVSCGLIGEAITTFEGLELWDSLIYCYCLLGKKAAAVELIKKRLSEMPQDPRLWCSLGDVTNNDSCYEKALDVSNNKSVRAKRALARSAYNRGDFETSKILWESAMALNSLYPDGWFAFGAAALKARDVDKALDAFTRAVQLDPDNGEAWNNIACLHMIKKKSKEAFIAFKEALKFKRDSWQLWENYSQVAMDVGNIQQALEAVQMVFNISRGKRIDAELLDRVMLEIEERASIRGCTGSAGTNNHSFTNQTGPGDYCNDSGNDSEVRIENSRETDLLVELLGKILQQMVKSGGTTDVWGIYARWHKVKGDLPMCSEALLKQVRSYQGSDLWKDRERFKKFVHASLNLCKVYMEISSSTGSRRELNTAEMHLRNIIKQGESFSDMEEFRDVQACLDEVKMKLQSQTTQT